MKMASRLVYGIAIVLFACTGQASRSLDRVVDLARSKAFRSQQVDWVRVEREAKVVEAEKGEDAAIRFVVSALGDRHTFYRAPNHAVQGAPAPAMPAATPIAAALPSIDAFPVIRINHWAGVDPAGATQIVRSTLEHALADGPCGVILDFSRNSGGNMWPMLIGLDALLAEGRLGAFRQADGSINKIEKVDGVITTGGKPHFLNYPRIDLSIKRKPYIAIVVGPGSASSGEITPLMFHGQQNVKFFGRKTAGFTSANQVFPLPNGGTLVLTTAMTEDRNGEVYPDGIQPDVATESPLEDSAEWLSQQCAH
jgi:hypothetical protein